MWKKCENMGGIIPGGPLLQVELLANEKGMVLGTKTDVLSGEWLVSVGLDA